MYTVIFWFTSTFNTPYLYTTNIQTRIGGVMVCALDSNAVDRGFEPQSLVSFKKYMPPPLPYFKVNICPFPLPHFGSIFFAYLWSFRWPIYIVTLPRYFSFPLPSFKYKYRANWTRIFSKSRIFYFSVTETDTVTFGPF